MIGITLHSSLVVEAAETASMPVCVVANSSDLVQVVPPRFPDPEFGATPKFGEMPKARLATRVPRSGRGASPKTGAPDDRAAQGQGQGLHFLWTMGADGPSLIGLRLPRVLRSLNSPQRFHCGQLGQRLRPWSSKDRSGNERLGCLKT